MRILNMVFGMTLCAGTMGGTSLAADLPLGAAGVHAPANLGPIGNGRRDWLKWNCYSCHGNRAEGGMGPNIQHADSGDVSEAVLQGVMEAGMPSFHKYATAADANNIAAYLQSIGTKNEPTWVDWWNTVP